MLSKGGVYDRPKKTSIVLITCIAAPHVFDGDAEVEMDNRGNSRTNTCANAQL